MNKLSEFVLVDFIPQSILKLQKLVIVRMKKRGKGKVRKSRYEEKRLGVEEGVVEVIWIS